MSQFVVDFLNDLPDGSEAAEITEYRVFIGSREVAVRVWERGVGSKVPRYTVEAWLAGVEEPANGYTQGNSEDSLENVLHNVHWDNFRD